jgi:2-oxoglutarate ferredoxin oxidoreductase subunit gamma
MQDQEVSWMPSYGPEMRGGTANVTVILSDERISSPILTEYDTAIILNQQSMNKFEAMVKPGGFLLYDPNGITKHPERKDINIFKIEASKEAAQLGLRKVFNMIVLGGFLKARPIVKLDNVIRGLKKSLPPRYHSMIPENEKAISRGFQIVEQVQKV